MDSVTPLYDGLALFGPGAHVIGRANPVARVTRGFPGLRGLVTKTLGSRGARAEAWGVLVGPARVDQAAAEAALELYKLDGGAYPLLDSLGRTWPEMVLVDFEPIGEVYQDENGHAREYRAEFLGLTNPFEA